jgi:hypothetical protein
MMMNRRVEDMAAIVRSNSSLLLKLSATSFALTTAVAKLITDYKEKQLELQKDREYILSLKAAYGESAEQDVHYSEMFADVSYDLDKMLMELNRLDEQ